MPFAAGAKFDDGEIPGDDHGDDALFAGLKGKTHGDGAGKGFVAAGPVIGAVGEFSVFTKWSPDVLAVAVGIESGLKTDFDSRAFEGGDGELTVPGFFHVSDMVAIEDDALHGAGGTERFIGGAIEISGI